MTADVSPSANLRASLDLLAERIESFEFRLPALERAEREQLRGELAWTVREYLIPRLGDLSAPVLAVVIGSTGSGKSTLVNTLAQEIVSEPGAIRPTTRVPVVWAHHRHAHRYHEGFLTGYGVGSHSDHPLRVVTGDHPLLEGVTILDAPDFDSVLEEHRRMVEELLAVADLCVFVASAQRYADAVPWDFLELAGRRRLPILFVVNRLPREGAEEVVADYTKLLKGRGVATRADAANILKIPEQPIMVEHGGLPAASVASLRSTLETLADPQRRKGVVVAATRGAVNDVVERGAVLAECVANEQEQAEALRALVLRHYGAQLEEVARSLKSGTLIRGEVLRRWQDFLGTGELTKVLSEGAGRLRRWAAKVLGGPRPVEEIGEEAGGEIVAAIARRADLAAASTAAAWELDPAGKALLLASGERLWRYDDATPDRAERAVEDWLAELGALIEQQGGGKRRAAQLASFGVNAAAVVVLLAVFAQTGGLTGAEVGVAAGAAAAQQKILEHIFGSAAARSLVEEARRRLMLDLGAVLESDAQRFVDLVDARASPEGTARDLHEAAGRVRAHAEVFYGR